MSLIFWYLAAYNVPSLLLATRYTLPNPPAPIRLRGQDQFKVNLVTSVGVESSRLQNVNMWCCANYLSLSLTWPYRCGTLCRLWRKTLVGIPLLPFLIESHYYYRVVLTFGKGSVVPSSFSELIQLLFFSMLSLVRLHIFLSCEQSSFMMAHSN